MKKVTNDLGDSLKAILQAERAASLGTAMSSDLSEQRIKAYEYYTGEMPDMQAAEGESSAVSTDVQDVVEGALPIILDALLASDIVEFKPTDAADEEAARQETNAVRYVLEQNDIFLLLYTVVKDALLSKNGFAKWWMEFEDERTRETYDHLTEDAFAILSADEDVEIIETERFEDIDPETNKPATYYNARVEKVAKKKKPFISAMPPEEVGVSKNGRKFKDLNYWFNATRKTVADVVQQFPEKESAIRAAPSGVALAENGEATVRQTVQDTQDGIGDIGDINKEMRLIEVCEHYIRIGLEKDRIPRRYKVTTVGQNEILDIEEVPAWPGASGTPIIMTHRLFGRALADLAIDIQQIKTSLLRATLNNAYYANNARTEVPETHASENTIDDLLNNRVGGIVRTKMPGGLQQLETQPIGHWTLPIMQQMDAVRENRTGISRYNQGLDADSLNHTATGITRIMDAAEMRLKLMTRVFAETFLVDLVRGVHEMLQTYCEEPFEVQINKKWVTVDPREWKKRTHMKVTLPLAGVGKQMMIQFLSSVLGVQKEAMSQQGGPNGPLVSYQNIYNTCERMVKLAGLPGVEPFFMQPPPPNPNAPPPPDPKMVEAQAKAQATQAQAQHDMQLEQMRAMFDAQMEQMKAQRDHQREMDDMARKQFQDHLTLQHEMMMEQVRTGHDLRVEAFKAQEHTKIARETAANKPAAE